MIELKKEINELLEKLGQSKKFQSLEEFKKEREQQGGAGWKYLKKPSGNKYPI